LGHDWQWYAQAFFKEGNHSPTDGRVYFQEGWLRFRRYRTVQFVFGQFKPSFGRERFTPDFELYTIARSLVVRTLIPNGEFPESFSRDIGLQVDGMFRRSLKYAAGLFAGSGANRPIRGLAPMFTTRVTEDFCRRYPLAGRPLRLSAGAAFSIRNAKNLRFGTRGAARTRRLLEHFTGTDRRAGFEAAADWSGWSLRAESISARFEPRNPRAVDVNAAGYYVQGAKFIARRWQVVGKWEEFDPNKSVTNSRDVRWLTLGLNYRIRGDRLKLMADYVFRWERTEAVPNNAVLVQFQWFFL